MISEDTDRKHLIRQQRDADNKWATVNFGNEQKPLKEMKPVSNEGTRTTAAGECDNQSPFNFKIEKTKYSVVITSFDSDGEKRLVIGRKEKVVESREPSAAACMPSMSRDRTNMSSHADDQIAELDDDLEEIDASMDIEPSALPPDSSDSGDSSDARLGACSSRKGKKKNGDTANEGLPEEEPAPEDKSPAAVKQRKVRGDRKMHFPTFIFHYVTPIELEVARRIKVDESSKFSTSCITVNR